LCIGLLTPLPSVSPQPPRARRAQSSRARVRAHPRVDGDARAADQLPSLPLPQLALDANGSIARYHDLKRELMLAVDPSLYVDVEGSTDSEAFFFLALTMGLEDDPPAAVDRAVGHIEHVGRSHGIEHQIQMTVATTDGRSV
jgi:hypothetical protein